MHTTELLMAIPKNISIGCTSFRTNIMRLWLTRLSACKEYKYNRDAYLHEIILYLASRRTDEWDHSLRLFVSLYTGHSILGRRLRQDPSMSLSHVETTELECESSNPCRGGGEGGKGGPGFDRTLLRWDDYRGIRRSP